MGRKIVIQIAFSNPDNEILQFIEHNRNPGEKPGRVVRRLLQKLMVIEEIIKDDPRISRLIRYRFQKFVSKNKHTNIRR